MISWKYQVLKYLWKGYKQKKDIVDQAQKEIEHPVHKKQSHW